MKKITIVGICILILFGGYAVSAETESSPVIISQDGQNVIKYYSEGNEKGIQILGENGILFDIDEKLIAYVDEKGVWVPEKGKVFIGDYQTYIYKDDSGNLVLHTAPNCSIIHESGDISRTID